MDIIFQGLHDSEDALKSLKGIIHLFEERYHIHQFREIHLSVTLVDDAGHDVELVDSETNQAFRVFEVHRQLPVAQKKVGRPSLKLVINHSNKNDYTL